MKVVCINKFFYESITEGKIYELKQQKLFDDLQWMYFIINDAGFEHEYLKECFKYLDDIREDKLNKLGL